MAMPVMMATGTGLSERMNKEDMAKQTSDACAQLHATLRPLYEYVGNHDVRTHDAWAHLQNRIDDIAARKPGSIELLEGDVKTRIAQLQKTMHEQQQSLPEHLDVTIKWLEKQQQRAEKIVEALDEQNVNNAEKTLCDAIQNDKSVALKDATEYDIEEFNRYVSHLNHTLHDAKGVASSQLGKLSELLGKARSIQGRLSANDAAVGKVDVSGLDSELKEFTKSLVKEIYFPIQKSEYGNGGYRPGASLKSSDLTFDFLNDEHRSPTLPYKIAEFTVAISGFLKTASEATAEKVFASYGKMFELLRLVREPGHFETKMIGTLISIPQLAVPQCYPPGTFDKLEPINAIYALEESRKLKGMRPAAEVVEGLQQMLQTLDTLKQEKGTKGAART